jgi:hypothetical protein
MSLELKKEELLKIKSQLSGSIHTGEFNALSLLTQFVKT